MRKPTRREKVQVKIISDLHEAQRAQEAENERVRRLAEDRLSQMTMIEETRAHQLEVIKRRDAEIETLKRSLSECNKTLQEHLNLVGVLQRRLATVNSLIKPLEYLTTDL